MRTVRPSTDRRSWQNRDTAWGSSFHSHCSMIRRCSTSGVSSGRTSTAFCRTMGPPSHSGLTKWTVAPDSLTP